jgi:hypothetical protein
MAASTERRQTLHETWFLHRAFRDREYVLELDMPLLHHGKSLILVQRWNVTMVQ